MTVCFIQLGQSRKDRKLLWNERNNATRSWTKCTVQTWQASRNSPGKREGNDNSSHKKWNVSGEYPQTPALQFEMLEEINLIRQNCRMLKQIGQEKSKASSSMTFNIWHKSPSRTHFMYTIPWKPENSASWPEIHWPGSTDSFRNSARVEPQVALLPDIKNLSFVGKKWQIVPFC